MNMALSVEGSQCQARPCGLFCKEWVPPNTCGYLSVACCPWLSLGAHTEHEALGYALTQGTIWQSSCTGREEHFEHWLLTLCHSLKRSLTTQRADCPTSTMYAGQKQLVCPISLYKVKPCRRSSSPKDESDQPYLIRQCQT